MFRRTRRCTAMALALASLGVAAPAAALAQSAGDEQYADPFSQDQGKKPSSGGNAGTNSSGDDRADAGSQAAAPSTPSTDSDPATSSQTSGTAAPSGDELPRTGYPAWLAALAGGVMLASGGVLRVCAPRRA